MHPILLQKVSDVSNKYLSHHLSHLKITKNKITYKFWSERTPGFELEKILYQNNMRRLDQACLSDNDIRYSFFRYKIKLICVTFMGNVIISYNKVQNIIRRAWVILYEIMSLATLTGWLLMGFDNSQLNLVHIYYTNIYIHISEDI